MDLVKGKYANYKQIPKNSVSKSEIKTKVITGSIKNGSEIVANLQNMLNEDHLPYYSIVYKFNEVILNKIKSKVLDEELVKNLDPEFLKEVRIFSERSELYLWRINEGFSYRYREDGIGNETAWTYEEYHICWGTQLKKPNHLLEEFRGIELKLPFDIEEITDLPLRYLVRNYFTYDKDNFITFFDARIVKFVKNRGDI